MACKGNREWLNSEEDEAEEGTSIEHVQVPFDIVCKTPQKEAPLKIQPCYHRSKTKPPRHEDSAGKGQKKFNDIFHYFSRISQNAAARAEERKTISTTGKDVRHTSCHESLKKLQSLSVQSLRKLSPASRGQQNPYESF